MSKIVNIHEAKTQLSRLLKEVAQGEDIILARAGKPCARIIPYQAPSKRVLGFVEGQIDEAFFEPLSEEDLQAWE